ncbi:GNAT family N-acetyltransferase [Zunongwangia sp.]|uniref:GNAT family N-acetyltransferase n=1 Tax=Zunongwangia sp. TaxID=1965325 RepID=UPI003AA7C904
MDFIAKNFNELSINELYEILRLRSEVFVVEQDCVYQDIDNKDQQALHIIGIENGKIVAYARCFNKGIYFKEAAIGRVIINKSIRGRGCGNQLLNASIQSINSIFNTTEIRLSAQQHLTKFYESHGFLVTGEGYLEDGIPHIDMIK